ncbi:MAG: hydrogenase maturation protease [Bacteroidetes bacterium]|nr:MAG: hydrogenase maturation protease [Bacteroidota bacterium]
MNSQENNPDNKSAFRNQKSEILIVGIGNHFRSDDAIGILVAEQIKQQHLPRVDVMTHNGEGASLMELWEGYRHVIIIDAVSSGAPPGTIHILNPRKETIPTAFFHYSTHAFSLAEAIEVCRALGNLPQTMTIIGIEGENFEAGETLSSSVHAAMKTVVEEKIREIGSRM